MKFELNTEQYSSMIVHINHKFTRHVIPARCLGNGIAVGTTTSRPKYEKGFLKFSFG